MKIAIVEDHLMVRDFVKKVCLQEPDLEVVVEAATGKEAVAGILSTSVDIVMLDIELPDFDGIEVLSRIREYGMHPLAIVLSCHVSPYLVFRIEKANIPGFVDKRAQTANELRSAIRAIRSNRTFYSPSFLEIRNKKRLDPLAFDNLERPCGRGLLLMRHYMTDVVFHAPGNKVTMSKVRSQASHRNGHS